MCLFLEVVILLSSDRATFPRSREWHREDLRHIQSECDHRGAVIDAHDKRVEFGFDLPTCFVTLATMFSLAPAVLPIVGIGNPHLYRRHRPEQTALYPVIETNLTPFLEYLHERDAALPRFVTDEFKDYLRCGRLEYGYVRVKCDGCRHETLWPFRASAAASARRVAHAG